MSKLRTLAVIIIVATALASCNSKSKFLVNTWKVEDIKPEKPVTEQTRGFFDALLQHTKEYYRVTYRADGTFELQDGGQASTGTWTLSKDNKQLVSTAAGGQPVTFEIVELTEKKLVCFPVDGRDKVTYYMVPATGEAPPAPAPAPAAGDTTVQAPAGASAKVSEPAKDGEKATKPH